VLAWRDVSVRCKQTVIGTAWALIRPFLIMVVFTVIFGKLARLPSDGDAPYALMVFVGMLPWTFFSTALADASGGLIGNASLISKVDFPRLIVPTTAVVVAFVDFLISFVLLVGCCSWGASSCWLGQVATLASPPRCGGAPGNENRCLRRPCSQPVGSSRRHASCGAGAARGRKCRSSLAGCATRA
jgi:ABC-type polysaccharide/polyol phosphate export permease